MVAHGEFEVAFHGEYREVVPDERIVSTEVYEGAPETPGLATTTFIKVDGRTRRTILVEHTSRENRDAHLDSSFSGVDHGLRGTRPGS